MRLRLDDAGGVASYGRAMELRIDTALIPPPPPPGAQVTWPPPAPARWKPVGNTWTGWTLATVATIWTAVVLISVFSPDMIHGSEQQRMPVAAFGTWVWGLGASVVVFVALARLRGNPSHRPLWMALFGTTVVIWSAATLASVFGPTVVTGSDPTTIPMAALIAPIGALVATVITGATVLITHGLSRMQQGA
jgi:hypothetical protein